MTALTILIPAAGAASRMRGGDKLLEDVAGQPMLRHQALLALATGCPTLVTLRPGDVAREATLAGLNLTVLAVPDADSGMSASLRRAAAKVRTALMILPGDMPDLTADDLKTLIAAFAASPGLIHRGATDQGRPGHPVILPERYLPDIQRLSGDEGARSILAGAQCILVPLPSQNAITDLDTPEDWAIWRRLRQQPT